MDSFTCNIITVILLSIALCFLLRLKRRKNFNLPPGPYSFPIIGSIIQIAWIDHRIPMAAIQALGKKYGPVVSLQMGSVYAVGINGFEAIKELETNPEFMDRINEKWIYDRMQGVPLGLIVSDYESGFWGNTRTTFHKLLREYGFGRNEQMYNSIMEEIRDFVDELKDQCMGINDRAKVHIENQFQVVMLNIVWSIGAGERLQAHDDEKLKKLSYITNQYATSLQIGNGIGGLFPKLLYMFPKLTGYNQVLQISHQLYQFFDEIIQERIESGQYKSSQLNLIDSFLHQIEKNNPSGLKHSPKNNVLGSIYTRENLNAVLQDLSLGGNDTTANSLNFIIRYIIQNPKVQQKLHEEIERVVGHDRLVIMEDKANLIYVQAVILEGLRISSVATSVPRRAAKDYKFQGYDIPKDTLILPNYYGSNRDEQIWENPESFIPERFINQSQTALINTNKLLSFGIGKRNCIGENVAKSSLFLILTSLLQQFYFEVDPDYGMPLSNTLENLTRDTEPYNIIVCQKY